MSRTAAVPITQGYRTARLGPTPYLLVGLGWLAFLMLVSRVRTIEPIFLWVLTQGLLVEKVVWVSPGWWKFTGVLFASYMIVAIVAWWLVERPDSDPAHIWRRAFLAWLGVQLIYCVVATALVQLGLLYE